MTIPIQDPLRQYEELAPRIEQRVLETLRSGWYLGGDQVRAFEREFASYCGVQHAVTTGNGTDALEIALRALGCGRGDEVVMVANAGMYAAAATLAIGAVPVFVDVRDADLLIDPSLVPGALSERTVAVVATHLYGKLADVAGIRAALGDHDIPIVEDCAHAHGARRDDRRAGGLGRVAAFSFYPTKNLGALGDAGAVLTDDGDLADRAAKLRQYGWEGRFRAVLPGGRNSRMDEIQAASLRMKLEDLDAKNEHRRAIAARYARACAAGDRLRSVHPPSGDDDVHHLFVVRAAERERVREHLAHHGLATEIHYPVPDHRQPALRGLGLPDVSLPVTESSVREILTVPCFPELSAAEVETVCEALATA